MVFCIHERSPLTREGVLVFQISVPKQLGEYHGYD